MSNQECDTCGAPAVAMFEGYPICDRCEQHVMESLDQEIYGICDDCGEKDAERIFLHLDGRRFHLCNLCYYAADHEDDYLMFCECKVPMCEMGGSKCSKCNYKIRSWDDDGYEHSAPPEEDYEEDYYEDEDADEEEWNRPITSY